MLDKFVGDTVTLDILNQVIVGRLGRYYYDYNTQFYRVVAEDNSFFIIKDSEVDLILIRKNNITIIIND